MSSISSEFDKLFKYVNELKKVERQYEKALEKHFYGSKEANRLEDKIHAIMVDIRIETQLVSIMADSNIEVYRDVVIPYRVERDLEIHAIDSFDEERGKE